MLKRMLKTTEKRHLAVIKKRITSGEVSVTRITQPGKIAGYRFSGDGLLVQVFFVPTCLWMGHFVLCDCEIDVPEYEGGFDIEWLSRRMYQWWSKRSELKL